VSEKPHAQLTGHASQLAYEAALTNSPGTRPSSNQPAGTLNSSASVIAIAWGQPGSTILRM